MLNSIYTEQRLFLDTFNKNNWFGLVTCDITDTEVCEIPIEPTEYDRSLLIIGHIRLKAAWNNFDLFIDPIIPNADLQFCNLMEYVHDNVAHTETTDCIQFYKNTDHPTVMHMVDFYLLMRFARFGQFSLINGECTYFDGNQNYIYRLARSTETSFKLDNKELTGLKVTTAGTQTRSEAVHTAYVDIFQKRYW